jgi:hypothetical protein
MALHYRGHDWGRTEFYFLRDSAQKELQRVRATWNSNHSAPHYTTLRYSSVFTNAYQ